MSIQQCAAVASMALLFACAPPPPLSYDPRVSIMPQTGLALAAPLVISMDPSGFSRVSIPLRNVGGQNVAANCIADWYGPEGHPVGGLSAMPHRIVAAPYAPTSCELVSPNARARSFAVQIVPTD